MKSLLFAGTLALVSLAGCTAPQQSSAPLPDRTAVDAAIDEAVSDGVFPFLYVLVERLDGSVVYEHSAHNSDFVPSAPTADTWMRLWSMSKSVTIATILDLEEDGILSRSDLVTDYIPEFAALKLMNPDADLNACHENPIDPPRPMTIEDLLNHTDGFYYSFTEYECLNEALDRAALPDASSSDDLINRIAGLTLHPSGMSEYHYGIGTTVLSLVAERATGLGFDEIVETRLTGPLGISQTLSYKLPAGESTYQRVTGVDGTLRFAETAELDIFGGSVPQYGPETDIYLGGEGMVGTTRGFSTFLRMMGNIGELDGVRILEPETVRDWYAPKTQLDSPYGKNGYNIWVTSGLFDNLPNQKPGFLVGGGYEGTAFWIDLEGGYVGLIMSQVHAPALKGVDEVSKIRGLLYSEYLEPGVTY